MAASFSVAIGLKLDRYDTVYVEVYPKCLCSSIGRATPVDIGPPGRTRTGDDDYDDKYTIYNVFM